MAEVIVYHKDYCPYCKGARQLLESMGIQYQAIEVGEDPALFDAMVARSGRRTVPQVFFGDLHVGGFDDLQQYLRDVNELSLQEA